jgi:hypothetical protein
VLDVHVGPELGPPLGEVTRGFENPLGGNRGPVDDVNLRPRRSYSASTPAARRFSVTTATVSSNASVGLNSTTSVSA